MVLCASSRRERFDIILKIEAMSSLFCDKIVPSSFWPPWNNEAVIILAPIGP